MNSMFSRIACATAAVAVGGFLAAGAAQADIINIAMAVNGNQPTNVASGTDAAAYGPHKVDGYNINIVGGEGDASLPGDQMEYSDAIDTSTNGTTNSLDVYVTEKNITGPVGNVDFLSSFTQNSLTSGWTVTQSTWLNVDDRNPAFYSGGMAGFESHSIELGSVVFTTSSVGGTITSKGANTGPGPYSLTELYVINPCSATGCVGGSSNATIDISVPEPGTLALLGAGLLGCALFVGRRRRSLQSRV